MLIMFYINSEEKTALEALGNRLEQARLKRNETQTQLAARIGVTTVTYQKMTQGKETVKIGYWIRALRLLSDLDKLNVLLDAPSSYFADKNTQNKKPQKRVKRKNQ